MNIEIIKKDMSEKKTRLPQLKNPNWKTVRAENEQNKRIINSYLNNEYQKIKRTNLCWSEISQW